MALRKALAPAIDLIFPPRCPLCGVALSDHTGLCVTCWSDLAIPGTPGCSLCQRPFGHGLAEGLVCAPCLSEPPTHDGVAAGTIYNPTSRKLVLAFKYAGKIALAPMLARLMAARLRDVDEHWLVVPVPLHRWRLWGRGYNQAALLSREISRLTGAKPLVDGLVRRKHTPKLAGLGREARAHTVAGAIKANPGRIGRIKGAKIILVDDVLTTGATSNACIAALKHAGAQKVVVACFARVMDDALPHI